MKNKTTKLPQIPNKRYFTIGEVGHLCLVKPHVLRYWEQEFPQLKPAKRRGNRRYYQREDVIMVRNIRGLLYDEGYTISGARIQLDQVVKQQRQEQRALKAQKGQSTQKVDNPQLHEISYSYNFTVDNSYIEANNTSEYNQDHESIELEPQFIAEPENDAPSYAVHVQQYDEAVGHHRAVTKTLEASNHQDTEVTHSTLDTQDTHHVAQVVNQEHQKVKKYKIALSDVIIELKEILAEFES